MNQQERDTLLKSCRCPICRDTGFDNGQICVCITCKKTGNIPGMPDEWKDIFGDMFK